MHPTDDQIVRFRTFGFVVLRGALGAELTALSAEATRVVRDATGDRYGHDDGSGGIVGHYIPATGERTPVSLALALGFAPVAEALLGVPLMLAGAHHNLLFDAASWHTDTGHEPPSVNVVAYLEALDATSGALRVLPGSHAAPYEHFTPFMQGAPFRDDRRWRQAVRDVPCHVVATEPGDVIVFDEHLWHASIGGRNRRQWRATYVLDPRGPDDEPAVAAYLASQFVAGGDLDYDPVRYPIYGEHFRRVSPRRWVEQLDRLGAFAAAAAEEGQAR